MTQHVGHIFQCCAVADHLGCGRMTEAVGSQAASVEANTLKKVASDPSSGRRVDERLMGSAGGEKNFTMRATWPLMLEVLGQESTDIAGQRQSPLTVSLRTPDVKNALVPVNVFQTELARLATAKSQLGQKQDEGPLAPCSTPGRVAGGEHVFEFFGGQWARKRGIVPTTDAGNGPNQGS